jgi:hypothetical protein
MEASMKALWLVVVFPALGLGACSRYGIPEGGSERGRFAGIGIYSADKMWSQILGEDAPKSPASARLKDDQEVIVVVDSHTGEIRQCGNLSGFCVAMNPWSGNLSGSRNAPLSLGKHAEVLSREEAASAEADAEAARSDARQAAKDAAEASPKH